MAFSLKYHGLRRRYSIWVHGHRGSASSHPENSLASFEAGAVAGSDLIELDVHLTGDGIPIVFHDEMISNRVCRDSNGHKLRRKLAVRKHSLEELQAYDIGRVKPRKFKAWSHAPGQRIPSLDAVCAWASKFPVGLNIEIKMGGEPRKLRPDPEEFAHKVAALVKHHGLQGRVQLQSFFPEMVAALSKVAPGERISFLVDRGTKWVPTAKRLGATVVGPRFGLLDEPLVEKCHGEGLGVVPWTVNRESHWNKAIQWGVDGIITDYPAKLVHFLMRLAGR